MITWTSLFTWCYCVPQEPAGSQDTNLLPSSDDYTHNQENPPPILPVTSYSVTHLSLPHGSSEPSYVVTVDPATPPRKTHSLSSRPSTKEHPVAPHDQPARRQPLTPLETYNRRHPDIIPSPPTSPASSHYHTPTSPVSTPPRHTMHHIPGSPSSSPSLFLSCSSSLSRSPSPTNKVSRRSNCPPSIARIIRAHYNSACKWRRSTLSDLWTRDTLKAAHPVWPTGPS